MHLFKGQNEPSSSYCTSHESHYILRYFLGDEGQAASGGGLFGFFGSSSPAPAPAPKPAPKPQPAPPAPEAPKKSPTFSLFGGGPPAPAPKPQPASPAPAAPKKSPTFSLFGGGSPSPALASNDKAKQVAEQKKRAAEEARAKAAAEVCLLMCLRGLKWCL